MRLLLWLLLLLLLHLLDIIIVHDDQPVLLSVLLKLILDCSHYIIDLLAKKLEQCLTSDLMPFLWLLHLLLLVNDLRYCRVVLLKV